MNWKVLGFALLASTTMISCGISSGDTAQSPVLARAQSYSNSFAQIFVFNTMETYGLIDPSSTLAPTLVSQLTSGLITPSMARDRILDTVVRTGSSFVRTNPEYGNPNNPGPFVTKLYRDYLGREPDTGGLAFWTSKLRQSEFTAPQLRDTFLNSAELAQKVSNQAFVNTLYGQILRRTADAGGLQAWVNSLNNGVPRSAVTNTFLNSGEYASCQFISNVGGQFKEMITYRLGGFESTYAGPLPPTLRCF